MKKLYWLLPIILFMAQAIYTSHTLNQIRYEELEESVSNPYWVAHGVVLNGASSNLGWHFLMVAIYNFFGFNLFVGKFVRLFLSLVSLFCLAAILKKFLGVKLSWLPLLTIGLSPTLLYFNTEQTVYGIDLQFLPIILYLLIFTSGLLRLILPWVLAMIAWMSYPSFIYYLPALGLLYRFRIKSGMTREILISLASFLTPLVLAFLYISNRHLLIYDDKVKSGMFRGAGFFNFDLSLFLTNFKFNLINLFSNHFGYYYEINKVEFGDYYPILSIIFIIIITVIIFKTQKRLRFPLALVLSILLLNVSIAYFTVDPTPGMRRQTGILASIYIFLTFVWYYIGNLKSQMSNLKFFGIAVLSLLLVHHIIVYPINLAHLKDPSQFRETIWFNTIDDPQKILESDIKTIQSQDVKLLCQDKSDKPLNCSYSQIYAALSSACLWNSLNCHKIYGFDLKTNDYIPLSIDLFNNYYFGRYGQEIIAQ